jgi:hypothetical protein
MSLTRRTALGYTPFHDEGVQELWLQYRQDADTIIPVIIGEDETCFLVLERALDRGHIRTCHQPGRAEGMGALRTSYMATTLKEQLQGRSTSSRRPARSSALSDPV